MFDKMTSEEAKVKILDLVKEYHDTFHIKKKFTKGDRVNYAGRVYNSDEICNLTDAALEFWLTSGRFTKQFENGLAEYLCMKHSLLVNSGSSANLLAFMSLTSPLLGERAIKRGDEVISVAASFPTTVSPIVQYGAVPVFVDLTIPQYNIDVSQLENALTEKTKAVFIAHTLGNPYDLKAVKEFCDKYGLWHIEDNCDALGSKYTLDGKEYLTGTIGDIGTSSFFPAHHITMGEGGAVYTNDSTLKKIMLSMRDWGRDCMCLPGQDNLCGHRFDGQFGELPRGYDHKYVYSHFGYNFKATDMQAAIGVAQLDKLDSFGHARRRNFKLLKEALSVSSEKLILPEACQNSDPSWFGFPITCKEGVDRNKLVRQLEDTGIQTRTLFAGNIIRHPCFIDMCKEGTDYRIVGSLKVTDRIMHDTFWVGVYPGLDERAIAYMAEAIMNFSRNN